MDLSMDVRRQGKALIWPASSHKLILRAFLLAGNCAFKVSVPHPWKEFLARPARLAICSATGAIDGVTNFRASRRKLAYPPSFIALAFLNGLEYRNADVKRLHGDDSSISDRNLASLHLVTPQLTRLECVQQASISTRVCFITIR